MPRRLVLVLLIVTAVLPFISMTVLAAPPANDAFTNRIFLPLGGSGTITTLDDAVAHEANEPIPSCAANANDEDSVWFAVNLPAGKVTFTATGSRFAPVVTLYESEGPLTALGTELACAASTSDEVTVVTTLTKTVSAGPHIIRVANDNRTDPGALTLNYTLSLKPPAGVKVPKNDSFANATIVPLNKLTKTSSVEYATFNPTDPNQTCTNGPMYNSVWYKFTLPSDTDLTLLTAGSVHDAANSQFPPPRMMIFEEFIPGVLFSVSCVTGGGLHGSTQTTFDPGGHTYYVALFTTDPYGLDGASLARLQVMAEDAQVLKNTSFSSGLAPWKLKNATGDGLVSTPTGFDASSLQFVGNPDEASTLKQTVPVSGFIIPPDSLLEFMYTYKITVPVNKQPQLKIVVTFTDGSTQTFSDTLALGTGVTSGSFFSSTFLITKKGATKVTVTIKNKMTAGNYVLDNLKLYVKPLGYGLRDDDVLPLPPAG
jgi:hypothetical protein